MAKKAEVKGQKFVTTEKFNALENTVNEGFNRIADLLENKPEAPVATPAVAPKVESPAEKEVTKATANAVVVPPEWKEKADEILGDAVDHYELFYPRKGGQIFTVVIKKDKSNAPKDYLAFYKEDRRSKDIGTEGIEGVEMWAKLVKQNLGRPRI